VHSASVVMSTCAPSTLFNCIIWLNVQKDKVPDKVEEFNR
jgi:hypothetical protein